MATQSGRTIRAVSDRSWKSVFKKWEFVLVLLFIAVNIMNISFSSKYLNAYYLFTQINTFLVCGFIALPMAYILLLGEIDLSVGSIVALSATFLGVVYNAGYPMIVGVCAALLCGLICGLINGLILTRFTELAPMIVTLGTMTLFRGFSQMILEDTSTGGLQKVPWFYDLYYARLGNVPYMFFLFCLVALFFGLLLHKTRFGRHIYAIGSNRVAAAYAGVPVQRVRLISYALIGLTSGLSGVFFASWMGTVRYDVAAGYNLTAISMVVLGGISTAGGKGSFPGTVIAIFTIGLLEYGLGLLNVMSQTITLITGLVLIIVVMIPNLNLGRLFKKPANNSKMAL